MCAAINIWCGLRHCTEVRFATFLSDGFTTIAVINSPEKKLAKRTFVHCELKFGHSEKATKI